MITDEMIKSEFIHRTVARDMKIIYDTQQSIVSEFFTGGTGRLAGYLASRPFTLALDTSFVKTYHVKVLNYLRFLDIRYRKQDMEKRRRLALYNRVIWGVLYNETMPDLRYTFTKEIRQKIGSDLRGIAENKRQTTINF